MSQKMTERLVESDDLALARALEDHHPTYGKILRLNRRIPVVVDSNKVLGDLLWLSRRRTNPEARTDLLEVADAAVVTFYVPEALRAEVEHYLPKLAVEHAINETDLRATWQAYQTRLVFVPPGTQMPPGPVRDPKDLPFLWAADDVDAAGIITRDKDIPAMGGRVVSASVIRKLRDYARAKAFEVKTLMMTAATVVIAFMFIAGLIKLLIHGGRRAGWPIIIAVLAVIGILFAVSESLRSRASSFFGRIWRGTKSFGKSLEQPLMDFAVQYSEEKKKAANLLNEIHLELGVASPQLEETSRKLIP